MHEETGKEAFARQSGMRKEILPMSDWPKKIWVTLSGAQRCKSPDLYEDNDSKYVLSSVHDEVRAELISWRGIALGLIRQYDVPEDRIDDL